MSINGDNGNGNAVAGGFTKREYSVGPGGGTVFCYKSPTNNCIVLSAQEAFVVPKKISAHHDAGLAEVTSQINGHLSAAMSNNQDRERCLSILLTRHGPMLNWVSCSDNDPETMDKALGIIE